MIDLQGKVALVTGASRGIGFAIAQKLLDHGAYVVGTATSEKSLAAFKEYLQHHDVAGEALVMDVQDQAQIDAVEKHLYEAGRMPAILVNNAGITRDNLLLRMEEQEWFDVINTNLNGVYRVTKTFLKSMFRARYGRIITIGSVVGLMGNTGQTNYTAAKAAVIAFSKSLSQEMGSRGITANVVAPGFIETDMTSALPSLVQEEMLKRIPLRHFGQAEDIANAVCFLASDAAKYISGETLHVNGGMYMN